jgi:2-polyprenyl-3-methyl-5-hydroxy-6-metoxy-1,4-benzoquinol methylase
VFQLSSLDTYPNLKVVVGEVLSVWPEHNSYCVARFRDDPPGFLKRSDDLAALVIALSEKNLRQYCEDYKWMCEEFVAEEYFFRTHGRYRLSTFKEAYDRVYNDPVYMARYVRGILISQFIWMPHARAFDYFRTDFLPRLPEAANYLEVGPGHGLFLYFASQSAKVGTLEAWDVSKSSIAATRHALEKLNVTRPIALTEQDVLTAPSRVGLYDAAVISEVLEHLEKPDIALQTLHKALKPGGRVFINVPINSPAPDHIYLWTSIEEFTDFVKAQGFEIESTQFLPVTGATLERAIRRNLSISCIIIGRKPV